MDMRRGDNVERALDIATSRRSALRSIAAGSLGAVAALRDLSHGTSSPPRARAMPARLQPDAQPNIILILLDDMRADDLQNLPAVQELLVAQGTSFANFLATSPACAPARASILRGQYPHNHGVLRGKGSLGGFARFHTLGHEQSTVGTWLQEAGYRTALIGKYLNHYPYDQRAPDSVMATYFPPGWDEWAGVTKEPYLDLEINENGHLIQYEKEYATDVIAAKAVDFVMQTAPPYFLYLAPRAPHWPPVPAARHATAFADISAPRPPSFNEADVSDKPAWVKAIPALSDEQIAELDAYHVARLRTLLAVDELVGALVEALRTTGTLDTTYILLTSDNGYHLGEHRAAREKGSPYEEAIRVPLVVRGPAVPPGQTIQALASQADLAPTFATWADATIPNFVDGRSLVPLLDGGTIPSWRQTALVEHYTDRGEGSTKNPGFNAMRGEEFSYIEYSTGERELYDLEQDPFQLDNLAATGNPDLVDDLSKRLAAMTTCAGGQCQAVEDAALPRGMSLPLPGVATVTSPL
ncbi:MAG: sulfatase [Chloroflexi bacterium]|nr:sulfatase [Chloroflexota bacterium]